MYGIPMLKIGRSRDRFIFNMGIHILVRRHLYIETPPEVFDGWWLCRSLLAPCVSWWRHQMETFSALLTICAGNSPVPGEFPTQRPVTRRFDVLFDLDPNKRLSKQSWGWWFETPSWSLWRHSNVFTLYSFVFLYCIVHNVSFRVFASHLQTAINRWPFNKYKIMEHYITFSASTPEPLLWLLTQNIISGEFFSLFKSITQSNFKL